MARLLRHRQTLVYFDGPQLIVAADPVGTKYLCLLVETTDDQDTFFCVPISDARLAEFQHGTLDLLEIYVSPEVDERYAGGIEFSTDELSLTVVPVEDVPEHWYPQEGFLLTPHQGSGATIVEAKDRGRAIVHLALNPPEAREETKIEIPHLANGLRIYQRLVKHAYSKALRALSKDIRERESLSSEANYQMEVFAFSAGSFTVNMQSKASADWTGYVDIERALAFVDAAVSASNDAEKAVLFLRENRGHFLNAYRALLKFIVENDSPLSYEWSIPEYAVPRHNAINVEIATELYDILTIQESLTTERVDLTGLVLAASVINNTWTLRSEDGEHSGKVAPGSPVRLDGITLETQRYRFHCEEILQEVASTGEETTELLLLSYETL